MINQDFNLTKPAYSANEVIGMGFGGRTSVYSYIKQGKLKATKLGKKTIFLTPHILEFIASLENTGGNNE
jgi:hypothetical protein